MSLTAPHREAQSTFKRIPVTDDQREIWLASQLNSDASASYHLSAAIDLRGTVDESVLAYAVQEIINRHDALRIRFSEDGTTQIIAPQRQQVLELVAIDANTAHCKVEDLVNSRVSEPFDLARGPLVRSILFKQGPDRSTLLLVTHHIVTDGWSFGVLLDELSLLYSQKSEGTTSSLEPAMQYEDYVSWLNRSDTRAREASAREYWLETFRTPHAQLELPADHQRPAIKTYRA